MAKVFVDKKPSTFRAPVAWYAAPPMGDNKSKYHIFDTKPEAVAFARDQEPYKPLDIYNLGLEPSYWSVHWTDRDAKVRDITADSTRVVDHRGEKKRIKQRLEYIRSQINAECVSWEELAELQDLVKHIKPDDVQLLEAAGVSEFKED